MGRPSYPITLDERKDMFWRIGKKAGDAHLKWRLQAIAHLTGDARWAAFPTCPWPLEPFDLRLHSMPAPKSATAQNKALIETLIADHDAFHRAGDRAAVDLVWAVLNYFLITLWFPTECAAHDEYGDWLGGVTFQSVLERAHANGWYQPWNNSSELYAVMFDMRALDIVRILNKERSA